MKTKILFVVAVLVSVSFTSANRGGVSVEPQPIIYNLDAEYFVKEIRREKQAEWREAWKSQTDLEAEFIKAKAND